MPIIAAKRGNPIDVAAISPPMLFGHGIVASVYLDAGHDCIFTSANERETAHSDASLHYAGNALDYRTNHIQRGAAPDVRRQVLQSFLLRVQSALPPGFDVVLEAFGADNEHLHVEWQPKRSDYR